MLCDGFLVSVTWTEPRTRLKPAEVLHSTANTHTHKQQSHWQVVLWLHSTLPSGSSKDLNVYSFCELAVPGLNLPVAAKNDIYAAVKLSSKTREAKIDP